MENYIYNPIYNKSPKGACQVGDVVTYTLKINKFINVTNVYFVMHKDGECDKGVNMINSQTDDLYAYYEIKIKYDSVGHFWYHFYIEGENGIQLIRGENLDAIASDGNSDYLQLVYSSKSQIDESFREGIIYHIFVDRFNRSGKVTPREGLNLIDDWEMPVEKEYDNNNERVNRNCYGGNLQGILDKIPYFKSLNVSTLYLSPIFEANSSHKYNVGDYSKIDSMFGDEATLNKLIKECKKNKINIILDGVFNHTGSDSVYFNKEGRYKGLGAYQSTSSPYYDWYDFINYPYEYSTWWGIKTLPQTNENSGFFDYIAGENGILNKYMSMGLGGFRLDVVDELSNNFMKAICNRIKTVNKKGMVIGEVWEDASCKIAYDERKEYFLGGNLDSVTNYPMKNAILEYVKYGNVNNFVNTINYILDQYPKDIQNNLMNIIDTHDTVRALTYLGAPNYISEYEDYRLDDEEMADAIEKLKLASLLQYTIMGIPTVFYGDEVGMEGTKDPYCRGTYPWGKENLTILEWYEKLGNLRNNDVLIDGDLNIKYAKDGALIFERVKEDKKVVVAINLGEEEITLNLTRDMDNYFTGKHLSGCVSLKTGKYLVLVS